MIPYFFAIKCMRLYGRKPALNNGVRLTKNSYIKNACAFAVSFKGAWPIDRSHDRSRCCILPRSEWRSLLEEPENRQ